MNDKRRALGRGLGVPIPTDPVPEGRPVDVFFRDRAESVARQGLPQVPQVRVDQPVEPVSPRTLLRVRGPRTRRGVCR